MAERILVIGAGMAGLCVALSLAPRGCAVTLIERDGAPPDESADQAFFDWDRRGVGHLRHSHAFLARLRNLIKDHHPALLAQLLDAGCREIGFSDMLPQALKADYRPAPGDADMAVLTSRRTTLEWVIRRYVEALPNVAVLNDTIVRGLIVEPADEGQIRVTGLQLETAGAANALSADVVIDAGGKTSQAIEQLVAAGGTMSEECEDCGIVYFTRHFRLLPGQDEPPRDAAPGAGDLGFIKFGLFPGDNRCFSVTLAAPEIELELRQSLVRPEMFDRICAMFPGIASWTDPAKSEPISKVFGMGDLKNRWRSLAPADRRVSLGFFAVGDSLIRTNPLYGRGCSFAAIEADLLAAVLFQSGDPATRARLYDARVKAELTPYFDDMRRQDRLAILRASHALDPDYVAPLRMRIMASVLNEGVRGALRNDIGLMRAALRDFHMIDPPGAWLRRPQTLAKVVGALARSGRGKAFKSPSPSLRRDELMKKLGLTGQAALG